MSIKLVHRWFWRTLVVGAALVAGLAIPALPAQEPRQTPTPAKDKLTPKSFRPLHQLIQPEAGEYRWDEVAWVTSIWHARKKAAAENKPIFVFGTQGAGFNDPLGNC